MTRAEAIKSISDCADEIRRLGATSLYLYGSAARDELQGSSDVDLFVDYDPASDFSFVELVRLQRLLSERLGREVDLTTRAGLHGSLKSTIEASSIRVL
jgi:predicted nucleotidyltransferase